MRHAINKTDRVVVVSLNPAIDLTGTLNQLVNGTVNVVSTAQSHAAGKGLNVAHVLSDLGANVTLAGFLGEENQDVFHAEFAKIGVKVNCITVSGATRMNVKIVDENQTVTDINFPGFHVTAATIKALEEQVFELAKTHDYFVITGSLPQGFSTGQLVDWMSRLNALDKCLFFDSSREALKAGVMTHPWLIKPNHEELADLIGYRIVDELGYLTAASELQRNGIAHVVVSKGEKGVVWVSEEQVMTAQPPNMPITSTVGAGDTLVAGLCWGLMQHYNPETTLRLATALSALAVTQIGVGITDFDALYEIEAAIKINILNHEA